VTLLSRNIEKAAQQYPPPIKVAEVDYASTEYLTKTLCEAGGFDSLVILINRRELDPQIKLIDAAIAAGVPHIVPSSFGISTESPEVRALPPIKAKIEMERYLVEKADEGRVSYTAINTGLFFDW